MQAARPSFIMDSTDGFCLLSPVSCLLSLVSAAFLAPPMSALCTNCCVVNVHWSFGTVEQTLCQHKGERRR